jgi:hypothetical protein
MICSRIPHRYLLSLTLATLIGIGSSARAQGNPGATQAAASGANSEVLKLIKAGMPESVVVAKIRSAAGTFDTSTDALIHLKAAGATEAELKAMLAKSAAADGGDASETHADSHAESRAHRSVANVALPHIVVEPKHAEAKITPPQPEPTLFNVLPMFEEKNLIDSAVAGSGSLRIAADGHSAFGALNLGAGSDGLYRFTDNGEKQRIDTGKEAGPIVITQLAPDGSSLFGYSVDVKAQFHYFYWNQTGGFREFLEPIFEPDVRFSADGEKLVGTAKYLLRGGYVMWYGKLKPVTVKGDAKLRVEFDKGKDWSIHAVSISGMSPNADYVIGTYFKDKNSAEEAFLKVREDKGESLGTGFYPKFVTDDGTVIFGQSNAVAGHILRWTRQGGREDLGTLGGVEATIAHMTPDGSSVVGWFLDNKLQTHIVRWSKDKGVEDLGATGLKLNQIADVSSDGKFFVAQATDQGTTKQYFVDFADLAARREVRLKEVVAQNEADRQAKATADAEDEARAKKGTATLQARVNKALADGQPATLYALALDLESQEYPELATKLYKFLIDKYPGDGFAARSADRLEHARDAAVAKAAQEEADRKAAKQAADQQTALLAQQQQMEQKELAMNTCVNKCESDFEGCMSNAEKSYGNGINTAAALGILGAFIPGAGGTVAMAASNASGIATLSGDGSVGDSCLQHQTQCMSMCQ